LTGRVKINKFTFMLDSGASSSFVPEHLVRNLCLKYKN
jgi:predicted aspartyl protease